MTKPQDVLDFWLAPATRERWFDKDADFDAEIRRSFEAAHKEALAGRLDRWQETADGALALVILLDQFPRNMYRDTPRAFAADPKARDVTAAVLARGFDLAVADQEHRMFFYLPLEHSEDAADQQRCVDLVRERCPDTDFLQWAVAHKEVIDRFGRFPHRNAILGRPNTPEEEEYLNDPDAGF
ncbi:MAG: DUF924 domain-containing protein [Rhodospirillaceae bacterium]|nr:DUF924 domain-containing protein [Rhodospirillaceae bacterium]MDE0619232.1 DUF924 domain-containing protein [Rhodospirillaceae bacterium]